MNKHLLFLILAIFLCMVGKSQTNVSGNITTNTTWTKANSPYVLIGNVGVPSAYTLTIEPGVTVERNDDYQILINGAIQFNGTLADSIFFISTGNISTASKFFIEFQKCILDKSILSFLSFQNNIGLINNIRMGNEGESSETNPKNSGTLHISHSNLSNGYTATKGYQTTASMNIDSCIVTSGYILGYYARSEPINVSNSQIYNSTVESGSYNYGIRFINCYLDEIKFPVGCCGASIGFEHCVIDNSQIGDGALGDPVEDLIIISNSVFTNTSFTNTIGAYSINNSKFVMTDKVYNLDGTECKYFFSVGNLSMSNCEFSNSSGYTYSGIYLTGHNELNNIGNSNTIIKNQFTNLYDAVVVNDFYTIKLDSNNFSTVGRYDIVNYSTKDFSALYDYFQLNQGQKIDDVIYDQNDDLSYGLVTYTPYSTNENVLPVTLVSFTGNAIGHTVQLNWKITKETNILQYTVERKTNNGFTAIGSINASVNVNNIISYNFTDKTPAIGTNYYRLKMVDANGKYVYSSVVSIGFTGSAKSLFVYPNPAKSYVIVEHEFTNNNTQLRIVDVGGKTIRTITIAKGNTQTRLDITGIAKGLYEIVWQNGTKTESRTMMIE